ncbi:MAG TPA: hypothetical protein VMU55_09175, partial [Solirubrobacteraceae bacterium]|nr:hypothetical protein [Solirubrobacteraceae bacterium]
MLRTHLQRLAVAALWDDRDLPECHLLKAGCAQVAHVADANDLVCVRVESRDQLLDRGGYRDAVDLEAVFEAAARHTRLQQREDVVSVTVQVAVWRGVMG